MKNDERLWHTISEEDMETLIGLALPGAVKPLDLRSVQRPGLHGKLIRKNAGETASEPWKIAGLKNHQGINYLTGTALEGQSLFEIIKKDAVAPSLLSLMLAGISEVRKERKADNREGNFSRFSAAGTYFTSDSKILLLPEGILEGVLPLQRGESQKWEEALTNPTLKDDENLIFGWAVLAYRYFTGKDPFPLDGEEKELPMIRGFFPPVFLEMPELNEKLAEFIEQGLKSPGEVDLTALTDLFQELLENGRFTEPLTEDETAGRKETAEKNYRRDRAAYQGKRFFRRKGTLIMILIGAAAVIGGLAGTILSGVFAPPVTLGWTQEEVAEAFYRGINTLDVELVDGCVTGKAGKNRVNMVTSLYAISRVRMGYEMVNPYINAEEWAERQDPELEEGEQLYGIRNLKIKRLAENTFQAEYEEWVSYFEDNPDTALEIKAGPPLVEGTLIREELELVIKRDAWVIAEIRRTSEEKIEEPEI